MKRFANTKKKMHTERMDEVHLQLIADGRDSAMQVIASGDDGVLYALNIRKSVR